MRAARDTLGAAGVLGLGTLLFCASFYFSALAPAQKELAAALTAAKAAERAPRLTPVSHTPTGIDRLHAHFPPLERLPGKVEQLHRIGRGAGLELRQAEYRLDAEGVGLASYRVSLPVHGPYKALRRFIAQVLREMPMASIDGLRFERKKVGEPELDAHIQLTLYFQPPESVESR